MSDTPRTDAMVEKAKRPFSKVKRAEVCLATDVEAMERELASTQAERDKMSAALEWIRDVNACDYEYRRKAREALGA